MEYAENRAPGILPKRGLVGTILGGLVVALVLALVWGFLLEKSYNVGADGASPKNSILVIVELLLLAALVGLAVGILAAEIRPAVLWIAAGLGVVAVAWAQAVMGSFMHHVAIDTTILNTMGSTGISLSGDSGIGVTIGTLVLAAVAAACAMLGSRNSI